MFLSRTPKVVCPGPRLSTCSNKNHLKTIVDDIFYCLSTQLHASMITTWSLEWLKKGIFTYSSVCRPYFIHEIVGRIQYFRKEESSASYSYKSLLEPPLTLLSNSGLHPYTISRYSEAAISRYLEENSETLSWRGLMVDTTFFKKNASGIEIG